MDFSQQYLNHRLQTMTRPYNIHSFMVKPSDPKLFISCVGRAYSLSTAQGNDQMNQKMSENLASHVYKHKIKYHQQVFGHIVRNTLPIETRPTGPERKQILTTQSETCHWRRSSTRRVKLSRPTWFPPNLPTSLLKPRISV